MVHNFGNNNNKDFYDFKLIHFQTKEFHYTSTLSNNGNHFPHEW